MCIGTYGEGNADVDNTAAAEYAIAIKGGVVREGQRYWALKDRIDTVWMSQYRPPLLSTVLGPEAFSDINLLL